MKLAGGQGYLDRGVPHDVLGPLQDRQVGEAQLVGRLDQAHAVLPHVKQDALDVHRRRVLPLVHLGQTVRVIRESSRIALE